MSFFFLSLDVSAYPSVGDYAYLATDDGYAKEAEVLSYDRSTNLYQVKYTDIINGKIDSVEYRKVSGLEGITSKWVNVVLVHCAEWYMGVLETVQTPFGNFESCKLRDSETGETYNLGLVPFCILKGKLRTSDGYFNEYTIQKYRHGN
jgi:hypothetical protein